MLLFLCKKTAVNNKSLGCFMKRIITCALSLIMCLITLLSLCSCDIADDLREKRDEGIKKLEDELEQIPDLQDEIDELNDLIDKYNDN